MGNYTSKLFSHHNEDETKTKVQNHASSSGLEKIKLSTPPITKRKLTTDPRSVTMDIMRTPIEISSTPPCLTRRVASALPKYLQGKRYLETDFDAVMPSTTPEKCLPDPRSPNVCHQRTPIIVKQGANYLSPIVIVNQAPNMDTPTGNRTFLTGLDPRSPATDFDRTPILKPRSTGMENIDGTTECNIGNVRLSYCETTTEYCIPEIQTVSEIMNATSESLSLENRIDLCERSNNLNSSHSSSSEEMSDHSNNEEQITVIRNPKLLTSYPDVISTWTEDKTREVGSSAVLKTNEVFDESLGKTSDSDISEIINAVVKNTLAEPKSTTTNDKIKVWRDSISPNINNEIKNANHKNNEEIIIEFDDETTIKSTKISSSVNPITKIDDDKLKNQLKKRKPQQIKNENSNVMEEWKLFETEGKNLIDGALNRTPLGNRSNNHKRQPLTAKSPQQILRNKGLSTRTTQQENTPPHIERYISKTKSNGIQWDADTTVII